MKRKYKRTALLRILEGIENTTPETKMYINLFNSGVVIDTVQVRNGIIKFLKWYFSNKRVRKRTF